MGRLRCQHLLIGVVLDPSADEEPLIARERRLAVVWSSSNSRYVGIARHAKGRQEPCEERRIGRLSVREAHDACVGEADARLSQSLVRQHLDGVPASGHVWVGVLLVSVELSYDIGPTVLLPIEIYAPVCSRHRISDNMLELRHPEATFDHHGASHGFSAAFGTPVCQLHGGQRLLFAGETPAHAFKRSQ